jgi:hypothetical protein
MRVCFVPGCDRPASSQFSRHCNHHRSRLRRNGDPTQRGVTKAALKPYRTMVLDRMAKNADSRAWDLMDKRWQALVSDARARVAAYEGGTASPRQNITAAKEIIRLANEVEPREVVVTVAAMVLMQAEAPYWFSSDRAFDVQLVRRVRGLTMSDAPAHRDPKSGKVRRAYRELSPRAALVMAEWLRITLGILGQRVAMLERLERESEAKDEAALADALMTLR